MAEKEDRASGDFLVPLGRAAAKLAMSLLGPVAKEIGAHLKDGYREWRIPNAESIAGKAAGVLAADPNGANKSAAPRIAYAILDEGSKSDDKFLHEAWGNLLAASCTEEGDDDSGVVFIDLLSRLSSVGVKILNYVCERVPMGTGRDGSVVPIIFQQQFVLANLLKAAGCDLQRLEIELQHLESLDLISATGSDERSILLGPTNLGGNLYIRCQGSRQTLEEYYRERYSASPPDAS